MAENEIKFTGSVEFSTEDILELAKFWQLKLTEAEAEEIFKSPQVQNELANQLIETQAGFKQKLKLFIFLKTNFRNKVPTFDP